MDQIWRNLPPITKSWCVSIATTSALMSTNRFKLMNLIFLPDKAFSNQTWRLITSFCTFDELSMQLLFELFLVSDSCGKVEESFSTNPALIPERIINNFNDNQREVLNVYIERNRAIDFLYYFVQLGVSIIIGASLIHYKLGLTIASLGAVMCRVLIYIDAQNSPDELINIMGFFTFKKAYYPWIEAILTISLKGGLDEEFSNFVNGTYIIPRSLMVWFYLLIFTVGHFWWSTRDLLLPAVHHYDNNERRRKLKRQALNKSGVYKIDVVKEVLSLLLLPPWYWFILREIKNRRN